MLECGDKIGDYTLARFLGRGQFGEVWLAEKELQFSSRKVQHALKFLFNLGEEINLKSAEAEIDTWIEASGHPNVMSVLDMLVHKDHVVIASEYAEGGSLKNWMKGFGGRAPSSESALKMMTGILSGIEHLHSRNVVHRDLKPDNILLQGNFPRITDFGISRIISAGSMSTVAMGSPFYMSPESFDGSKSTQTDIWSAGVILYEMLTGQHPYRGDTIYGLVSSIRQDAPTPLPNEVPRELRQIVETALQKDLSKRYATAKDMRSAIELELHNLKVRLNSQPKVTNRVIEARERVDPTSETLESVGVDHQNDIKLGKSPKETHETNVRNTVGKKKPEGAAPSDPALETERSQETLPQLAWSQKTLTAEVGNVKKMLPDALQIQRPNEPLETADLGYSNSGFGNSQPTPGHRPFLWITVAGTVLIFGILIFIFVIVGVTKTLFWGGSNGANVSLVPSDQPPQSSESSQSSTSAASTDPNMGIRNKMVPIPGGDIVLRREGEVDKLVSVKPFNMDINEVTNQEYAAFVAAGHKAPHGWEKNTYPAGRESYPVVGVEWSDANEYAQWKGKRLPTEEEWQFAAQGTDSRLYPWGNAWDRKKANVFSKGLKPVGSYCNSPYGVCDLIGNAWEWTSSDFISDANKKVIRGGSYEADKNSGTTTYRKGWRTSGAQTYAQTGFRCVMSRSDQH